MDLIYLHIHMHASLDIEYMVNHLRHNIILCAQHKMDGINKWDMPGESDLPR